MKKSSMNKALKILFLTIFVIVVLLVLMRFAGYRPMKYPADVGNSMHPTISPGDIWLCRIKRGYAPKDLKQGMVIIFSKKDFDFLLTKRIIALENQTVEIKGRTTFVDGEEIAEPYTVYSGGNPSGMNRPHGTSAIGPIKVPPGKLFVMGDNRNNSFDSRDPEFGFVDVKDIVGQPILILWARDMSRIGRRTNYESRPNFMSPTMAISEGRAGTSLLTVLPLPFGSRSGCRDWSRRPWPSSK